MTEKPLKPPRLGATMFGLAWRDRALREAGLHDEADAAARRFEAVTGIDILAEDAEDAERRLA